MPSFRFYVAFLQKSYPKIVAPFGALSYYGGSGGMGTHLALSIQRVYFWTVCCQAYFAIMLVAEEGGKMGPAFEFEVRPPPSRPKSLLYTTGESILLF